MKKSLYFNSIFFLLLVITLSSKIEAQDLSQGLVVNDLTAHPMQEIAKPDYLEAIVDPSFGTTIRRITNAPNNGAIVPLYSTIQAWNADESLMIVYDQSMGEHQLLNGITYEFIRYLDDFSPDDIEQIFWDFNNPDIFYYLSSTDDLIQYSVSNQSKTTIVNVKQATGCDEFIAMGNDVQMMSWDNDVFSFRCGNESAYAYRISTGAVTALNVPDVNYTAPAVAPSGNRFYHVTNVLNASGNLETALNEAKVEHSSMGKLSNSNDAHFAISFQEGPEGGCLGDIIAHDLTTGDCFPIIAQSEGYNYPQSGTHISAVAHKNTEGGWLAASMVGYDQDGQVLLDQELVIAKADQGNVKVCRIGHHRSDEDQFDYWGEPHAAISPTGTRVLFASDWSGVADGQSVDCYVVELPVYDLPTSVNSPSPGHSISLSPNPVPQSGVLTFYNFEDLENPKVEITDITGRRRITQKLTSNEVQLSAIMAPGIYFYQVFADTGLVGEGSFVIE